MNHVTIIFIKFRCISCKVWSLLIRTRVAEKWDFSAFANGVSRLTFLLNLDHVVVLLKVVGRTTLDL